LSASAQVETINIKKTEQKKETVTTVDGKHKTIPVVTPKKENGLYPQPNSYTVKGGGTFADKVDNIIFVHRPYYATDKSNPEVTFGSLKIKKQKLVGIPQAVEGFQFKRSKNRYYIDGFNPLDNIYTEPNENVITLPQPTTEEAFNINKIIEPNNLSDLTDIDDEMPF